MIRRMIVIVLAVSLAFIPIQVSANLLNNPDFEQPAVVGPGLPGRSRRIFSCPR